MLTTITLMLGLDGAGMPQVPNPVSTVVPSAPQPQHRDYFGIRMSLAVLPPSTTPMPRRMFKVEGVLWRMAPWGCVGTAVCALWFIV